MGTGRSGGLDCRDCDGTGREIAGYSDYNFTARDPGASAITRVCTTCKGSGRSRCAYCGEREATEMDAIDKGLTSCAECKRGDR